MERLIVDTGVLVSAFDHRDQWASWTVDAFKEVKGPLVTCEAVLAETWYLLRHFPPAWKKVEKWLDHGIIRVEFSLPAHRSEVFHMMEKYRDLPMSPTRAS